MRCCLIFMLPLVALQSSLALEHLETSRWKSFREAELESAEYLFITNETLERYRSNGYPDEPSVRKLIGAIMVVLNAAFEKLNLIKDYVISKYFIPNTVDCLYKQHTKECLDRNVATLDPSDRLGRAYQTFQCYYKNYGGIKVDVDWVPYHYSEVVQIVEDCLYITNASNESLHQYCRGEYATNAGYQNVVYCYFVRNGFYDKSTGFNVQRIYNQLGANNLIDDGTEKCITQVVNHHCKEPFRSMRVFLDCVVRYVPSSAAITEAASNILGNPPECVVPPSPPPKTQPCYNELCP
ncbi:AAEL000350-PA [Aedes aegypti]|uniref:AAEL000350-PA n=1 Tax=Aedes aegypti TaxID=7159 RepID=Q17PF5_AEDAE|nr:AAEL000350-PA [Aedes aegypti]